VDADLPTFEEDSRVARERSRRKLALSALLLLALSSGCAAPATAPIALATSAAATAAPTEAAATATACSPLAEGVPCADANSAVAAHVIRIVDGDTLHVELDGRDETIRLYGIDAPEVGQPCAAEATARLRALAGGEVLLRPDARDRDRHRRLLRYVYAHSGPSIDAALVREGLAHAWRTDGALRFEIIAMEDAARAARRGCLWRPM
jgi:micrococcal nuclease